MGFTIRKAKKLDLGMGISQSEAKKSAEDATAEGLSKCMEVEAAGRVKNQ